ncbi:MAG: efflux transporter outer membrane subunit [Acidobacteriota bacterium]|nr:efflux transporter outer membrane subunit [Acidobacteriota bacterium]
MNPLKHTCRGIVCGSILLLSGCVVGPNYHRPTISAPATFRGQQGAAQQTSIADLPWWEVFKDKMLQDLIRTSLTNNYDLRVAITRVEQARQIAAQARAQYFPAINYQGATSGGKNESFGNPVPGPGLLQGALLTTLQSTWEADVWGRIRRLNENALAQFLASEQGRRGVMLSLVGDMAQAYFELLELDLQLEIAHRTTGSFDDSLRIFRQRLEAGTASKLETSSAEAALASTAANIPELERKIALKENQISVLIGANPGPITRSSKLLEQTLPPEVPAGLPSALLERRPDVLQAEQAVRAANAEIGVAAAAFFPKIGLTALLGQVSSPVADFTSGRANVWSFAGNAAGPLYQGGALRAQKRQAIAAWDQARLQYEQTALNAFQDVSNALISRDKYEAIRAEQDRAVRAYRDAVSVVLQRYDAGKSSYYEVLQEQQLLFPAENALAQTELNRRVVIVQLYRALGGGWNLADPDWTDPNASGTPTKPKP